ncbi:type I-E CRISPR-associated protein Cas5/CasD [Nocardioides campestrisoli]|uniref:type I-E CRISPR-associated protein Cas5/CasD n=1 Tax=Nocardioides campestrisoli TaxID=2736757 RepID=UPI00163D8255|nr:type I-E CRISPR-associated protein Cas5/CasD [Nocardioides campestrisoli]
MPSLLLRMAGPVQSYAGYRLLPNNYPVATAPMPRKSAVAGLLGAFVGRRDLHELVTEFDLHVRVDRTNAAAEDLQVLVPLPNAVHAAADRAEKFRTGTARAHAHHRDRTGAVGPKNTRGTALVNRDFLPHAEFICAITAETELVDAWLAGALDPVFMPYLGRRANAPAFPFVLGVDHGTPVQVLSELPHVPRHGEKAASLRLYEVTGDYARHEHRLVSHVSPTPASREEQLTWLSRHLSR